MDIGDDDVNEEIRIINSFEESFRDYIKDNLDDEEFKKEYLPDGKYHKNYMNEEEIKNNDELIPINYFHKFKNKGKYKIKYNFKQILKRINHMLCNCYS